MMEQMEQYIETILNGVSRYDECERGMILIKDMSNAIMDIVNYNHAVKFYEGDSENILKDRISSVRNSLALMISDMELYTANLNISESVKNRATKRLRAMSERVIERERMKNDGNESTGN